MEAARRAGAPEDFTVVAILAAYNEGDVVAQVIGDLVRQGLQVYLVDHGSTDDTVTQAEPFLGRGLLEIERLAGGPTVRWSDVLRRKEELAARLAADWFVHQDADELRESPWENLSLREAIRRVDRLGYNAIDFELLNFWPTHDGFRPGADLREAFQFYEHARSFDKVQVRCWRRSEHAVDLVSSGGHDAMFPGRKVFPVRFLLRHYPVRGQAHGERKVLAERLRRFDPEERARGWHVQYGRHGQSSQDRGTAAGASFLRDPASLILYDPERVRLRLLLETRRMEELEERLAACEGGGGPAADADGTAGDTGAAGDPGAAGAARDPGASPGSAAYERLSRELHARNLEAAAERERAEALGRELDTRHREAARLAAELDARNREVAAERERAAGCSRELDARHREAARLAGELDARNLEVASERERAELLGRELDARNLEAAAERERAEALGRELDARNLEAAAERERAEALGRELDARHREAARLAGELSARDAELAARDAEAARLAAELAARGGDLLRLWAELDARGRELAAILASRSWRWTAPLRAAARRSRGH